MNRLDSVLGPENWWDDYIPLENSVVCKLTLRLPDGSTVTKCDAGGYAGMADQGDDISDMIFRFHRAGWSVGSTAFATEAGGLTCVVSGTNGAAAIPTT